MTRKDYILLAEALRKAHSHIRIAPLKDKEVEVLGFNCAVSHLCLALETDNPRFNRDHFLSVVRGEKELHSRPTRKTVQS